MISEAHITVTVHLTTLEIWITMFKIWGFSHKSMAAVTGFDARRIKTACSKVVAKLGQGKPESVGFRALNSGFSINGTFNGEEIFTEDKKKKIQLIDPDIRFAKPPAKKK